MNKKYVLINCYTDNNKGDLGIILSTIDYLKRNDPKADISGVSTYNYNDPLFSTDHKVLRESIKVYPSVFGELNIGKSKGAVAKMLRLFYDTIRFTLFLILPTKLGVGLLFNSAERKTIQNISDADYVVSKGGSFICNEDNTRTKLALFRFMFIFFIAFKLKKKVIILAQSLGPVYGSWSKIYINNILQKCHKIVIREDSCKKNYQYLKYPEENELIINDIAFSFKSEPIKTSFNEQQLNIGCTIKYVSHNSEDYKNMMKEAIEQILINHFDAHLYIFPQVTVDLDPKAALEVYELIGDSFKDRITVYNGNYTARQLKYMYSKMDLFVATRLHSAIFSMGEKVPSVCIVYHGTKAQGVMKNMGSDQYVIRNYDSKELVDAFENLYNNRESHKKILDDKLNLYISMFDNNFNFIFN